MAKRELEEATTAFRDAEAEYKKRKEHANKISAQYGGLNLPQIASLRSQLQAFPQILGAQGMEDSSMFTSMKCALKQHQRLCHRIQILLEDDDAECMRVLGKVKAFVRVAIEESHFFAESMAPLKAALAASNKANEAIKICDTADEEDDFLW